MVLDRGGCAFIEKAKNAQAAGAAMAIVVNSFTGLSRFGVEPRWKGLGINIPVLMVSDQGGAALKQAVAAANEQGGAAEASFTLSKSVNSKVWDELEGLRTGAKAAWTGSAAGVLQAKTAEHAGWPERLAALQQGFALVQPNDGTVTQRAEL